MQSDKLMTFKTHLQHFYQISRWFDGLADYAVFGPGTTVGESGHLLEHSQCIPKAIKHRKVVPVRDAPDLILEVGKICFSIGSIVC